MIPKKIHYCWFGRNPLPKSAQKCIASWNKYFPDYEIIEWNEDNYDVTKLPYLKQAYMAKKYAFVSDYARFDVLFHEGGIYFDTDVEVIKSYSDILLSGEFMGCEVDGSNDPNTDAELLYDKNGNKPYNSFNIRVNPGLGIAALPGNTFYKEFLDLYDDRNFILPNGSYNTVAVVRNATNLFVKYGLRDIKGIQKVRGITIYPKEYFNPYDSVTGLLDKTPKTHSIHWYSLSWMPSVQRWKIGLARNARKLLIK